MKKLITCIFLCLLMSGCDDAKDAWSSVLKKCSASDLNGSKILYFGPSNNVGPGSIWRTGPDGGFKLRYSTAKLPGEKKFMNLGTQFNCAGSNVTNFDIKASAALTSSLTPMSIEVSNDFKKAKKIEVSVNAISWDSVEEGPFESYIKSLPALDEVREDIGKGGRLILYRALRVSGYSATLEFSNEDASALKAKYSGVLPSNISGEASANLTASWTSNTKLKIISTSDFYIAGELAPYTTTGFSSANDKLAFKSIEIPKESTIGID